MNVKLNLKNIQQITIGILALFNLLNINCLEAKEILYIRAIPDQNTERLHRLYAGLSSELSKQLNIQVRYIPDVNYTAALKAFRTGNLIWYGLVV